MKTQFYIILSLRTPHGFVDYGQYFLGNDQEAANSLFNSLLGSQDLLDKAPLHIDLMETINELPVKIRTICCTLDELGDNCRLIATTIFRIKTLKELNDE